MRARQRRFGVARTMRGGDVGVRLVDAQPTAAEIEIGILDRQCMGRRMGEERLLRAEVRAWEQRRNQERSRIDWKFTRQDADRKLARHYVT